ncbi:TetR/AcrR family transcriptional regulator [Luteolibacter soli]|uniref:TetR/AcrR family transcriptional regulator n=1 Tax=Luteolibacter soli TaxID=3135280 RepID=A0ABU9APH4_9BACT
MDRKPSNQELRTRKDLLLAAGRLLKQGVRPTMDEVAKEALISRATAYRYFKNVEALLLEVAVDEAVSDPAEVFARDRSTDPVARIDKAEASMHKMVFENEAELRLFLARSIGRDLSDDALPQRQNRRLPLIEAALEPARARFSDAEYEKLCIALAMIFGTESMIVARDVLRIDERTARKAKSWAVKALVQAAMRKEGHYK